VRRRCAAVFSGKIGSRIKDRWFSGNVQYFCGISYTPAILKFFLEFFLPDMILIQVVRIFWELMTLG
jgi:hypothetical protein